MSAQDDQLEEQHGRKRQRREHRRSIFFSTANSDSESDGDEEADEGVGLNGFGPAGHPCELAVVSACALSKGVLLSPITRRATSPCLASTSAFVAVHEEPNACFRSYMEDRWERVRTKVAGSYAASEGAGRWRDTHAYWEVC